MEQRAAREVGGSAVEILEPPTKLQAAVGG